jgi:processive 1,2-diacylglycerol beta-glucosyltransferase
MKKGIILLALLLTLFYGTATKCIQFRSPELANEKLSQGPVKKIAIAWSKGGGAHKSMLDALRTYFADSYELSDFCPVEVGWCSLDPIRKFTFGCMDGEDFYNCLLANDMTWLINKLHTFGLMSLRRHRVFIEKKLEEHVKKVKPDLIISVIPVLNSALSEVAARLKIPFLLIAPDLNLKTYFVGKLPEENFYCTLPFNDELGWKTAIKYGINPHTIMSTGFPLRVDFFEQKNRAAIQQQFQVPDDKPVIMILMGGVGSTKVLKYLRKIVKAPRPCHVIVCIGKKECLRRTIERMKRPNHVTFSIVGFTKQISDLMSISDVLISKPGPTSISEAIQMELPVILDNTSTTLELERLHLEFIKKNRLGVVVNQFSELENCLQKMLDPETNAMIRRRMKKFSNHDFPQKITKVVELIFHEQSTH